MRLRRRYGRSSGSRSITTKYMGPTNTRGSKIKATASSGKSLTVSYDYELDASGNHDEAAKALARKLGWGSCRYAREARGGRGNVYVCT